MISTIPKLYSSNAKATINKLVFQINSKTVDNSSEIFTDEKFLNYAVSCSLTSMSEQSTISLQYTTNGNSFPGYAEFVLQAFASSGCVQKKRGRLELLLRIGRTQFWQHQWIFSIIVFFSFLPILGNSQYTRFGHQYFQNFLNGFLSFSIGNFFVLHSFNFVFSIISYAVSLWSFPNVFEYFSFSFKLCTNSTKYYETVQWRKERINLWFPG